MGGFYFIQSFVSNACVSGSGFNLNAPQSLPRMKGGARFSRPRVGYVGTLRT